MLLTEQERERFAAYVHQESETNAALVTQSEKLGFPDQIVRPMKWRAIGWKVVADDLSRPVESVTITSPQPEPQTSGGS